MAHRRGQEIALNSLAARRRIAGIGNDLELVAPLLHLGLRFVRSYQALQHRQDFGIAVGLPQRTIETVPR